MSKAPFPAALGWPVFAALAPRPMVYLCTAYVVYAWLIASSMLLATESEERRFMDFRILSATVSDLRLPVVWRLAWLYSESDWRKLLSMDMATSMCSFEGSLTN